MPLVSSYCVIFVSGSSSVNKSMILASNEAIDFVFFSGANWSAGEVKYVAILYYFCIDFCCLLTFILLGWMLKF